MKVSDELVGKRFGKLTCIRMTGRDNQYRQQWLCECDCGNETTVIASSLKRGSTQSCGCIQKAALLKANTVHSFSSNGKGRTPRLYSIWRNMKQRCFNPKATKYNRYGGRGITVCEDWRVYINFHRWAVENGYQDTHTLDRKNGDGNYEPGNCQWVPVAIQNLNKSDNRVIEFSGKKMTLKEWSDSLDINYTTLRARLDQYGWSVDKAFKTPVGKRRAR
ncbi:hypothetical protein [Planomicrobium sp. MB-3u-38]|uniref:hypothetical protein n=1 Tax=Planomicrobium sp. MB-3u-38 TaxID=2058318 RepID=UPI000C7D1B36|nr:hypothetical protein [Planomicrobium sp. MB-3u-38]PKH09828.1 hypothetical protein CXF70_11470 [Planomicrobium sp. MB-3u-38]